MLYTYEDNFCLFRHKYNTEPEITSYENHIHVFHEILILTKNPGDGKDIVYGNDNFTCNLRAGDLVVSPSNNYHFLDKINSPCYERYIIGIKPQFKQLNTILERKILNNYSLTNIADNFILMNCLKRFDYYFANKDNFTDKEFSNLMHLLMEEFVINLAFTQKDIISNQKQHSPNLIKIISYINENLATVNVETISKHFYYSSTYIYKLFIRYLKISPREYITERKLHYAKTLLLDGKQPKDVASMCGYNDYSTFYRAFMKLFNYPPSKLN